MQLPSKLMALTLCAVALNQPLAFTADFKPELNAPIFEQLCADGKLTLDEAVQIALADNPDVLIAREEIRRVHGLYVEVRSQALPQIGVVASYDIQDENLVGGGLGDVGSGQLSGTAFGGANNESWRIAFEGSQLVYSGGAVAGAIKIADYEQASTLYRLRDTVDQVIQRVRTQFYQVIVFRSLINVQNEALELLEESLEDQQTRFDAGTVPRFNVLRAEVEVANQRPEVIRAENNYRISLLELSRTLGVDYQQYQGDENRFEVVGELEFGKIPMGVAEAVAMGIERRAFLKIQRLLILSEKEQVKVAMSGFKPRLSVVGGYEFRNDNFSDNLDDSLEGWFFGVRGSWDIFSGLETVGQVEQARARLESAMINYDDAERQVQVEIQSAYSRLIEALELIESQQKNVEQAKEALRLAQERFDVGAGTQLDLLDARVSLTQAQVTELEARFDFNSALAEFERVTAIDTVYDDTFEDPLAGKSKRWFRKVNRPLPGESKQ